MRILKRNTTFYLQHSFRMKGKVHTKEVRLGEIPEDVEKQKQELMKK